MKDMKLKITGSIFMSRAREHFYFKYTILDIAPHNIKYIIYIYVYIVKLNIYLKNQ